MAPRAPATATGGKSITTAKPEYSARCHGVKKLSSAGTLKCAQPSLNTAPTSHIPITTVTRSRRVPTRLVASVNTEVIPRLPAQIPI